MLFICLQGTYSCASTYKHIMLCVHLFFQNICIHMYPYFTVHTLHMFNLMIWSMYVYISIYISIYIYIVYILLTVDSTHLQKMNNNNNSTSSCSHQPAAGCFSPSLLKVFPGFRLQGFASTTCFRHRCGCQGSLGRDGGWMMFWTQVGCRGCFFLFVFFAGFVFCLFCFCVFFVFCL